MFWTQEQFESLTYRDKVRRFFNEGNPNNRIIHVRGFVDDLVDYEIVNRYFFSEFDVKAKK